MAYTSIKVETRDHVGLVQLDRPEARNALNKALMGELADALHRFDADATIGAMVITGDDKAFASGVDVTEMKDLSFVEAFRTNLITEDWEPLERVRKPMIAAVSGYALGGGCELAMLCDILYAADNAKFGLPEINIGIMPGAGGTQRLARFVGKSKAMEMVLTGRFMDAVEAERCGLVAQIFPADDLVDQAVERAAKIAGKSAIATIAAKESVNRAYETALSEGLRVERRLFHSLFATEDQSEGMAAFLEKRTPQFRDR